MHSLIPIGALTNYVPVPESGCWLWLGGWTRKGYGRLPLRDRSSVLAHRLFYEAHVGPIPDGLIVCHTCDTPACCNPAHLFVGTDALNAADKVAKQRAWKPAGGRNVKAKLDESQVLAIRADPRVHIEIAGTFGVSRQTVSSIKTRRTWQHLPPTHEETA